MNAVQRPALPAESATVKACVAAVSAHFGVSELDLLSSRRKKTIVRPRQIAMYLATRHTTRSLPEIGRRIGGRDHTTVIHGVRVVERLIETKDPLAADVQVIGDVLRAVQAGGLIAGAELPDPIVTAMDITQQRARSNPSSAEIRAMAGYIVERAIRAGEISITDADASMPDPELLPVVELIEGPAVDRSRELAVLKAAVGKLLDAEKQLKDVQYSRGEINARRSFEGALEALRSAFEEA